MARSASSTLASSTIAPTVDDSDRAGRRRALSSRVPPGGPVCHYEFFVLIQRMSNGAIGIIYPGIGNDS